jgi:hypothetical protein
MQPGAARERVTEAGWRRGCPTNHLSLAFVNVRWHVEISPFYWCFYLFSVLYDRRRPLQSGLVGRALARAG